MLKVLIILVIEENHVGNEEYLKVTREEMK